MTPKLFKNPSRFPDEREVDRVKISPSPDHYKTLEAFNAANSPKGHYKTPKDKRKCFVDTEAKLSISPGPAKNVAAITTYNWLSKGSTSRSRIS